jgi:hypothetical protein
MAVLFNDQKSLKDLKTMGCAWCIQCLVYWTLEREDKTV